jgi:nucleoside-diphosphate-sugar epimerase
MEHTSHDSNYSTGNRAVVQNKTIIIAGATGHLGQRIASHLIPLKANVIALVRKSSSPSQMTLLEKQGVTLCEVDFDNPSQLAGACAGADCIVSAVNGLKDVILDVQTKLLQAAVSAGVPRFIPSDYCIDYTKLSYGSNRNLDLRRKFSEQLDKAPVAATSILNGMFTDLLTGQAPVILFGLRRVVYWGDADQFLDFTTMENTAEYTALAALDEATPRYLHISADATNARGLKDAATEATGKTFYLLRAGSLKGLQTMIRITRTVLPKRKEVFPPWQGMQYLHNMFSGKPKLTGLDNDRYPGIRWIRIRELLVKMEQ